MGKINSIPMRVDPEFNELVKEIRKNNDLSDRQVSKEIARTIKRLKAERKKITKEIVF